MRSLILIRHSRVSFDSALPWHEWPLSREGRDEVSRLVSVVRQLAPRYIVSSTERKAIETAELLAPELGLRVECDNRLRENDRTGVPVLRPDELESVLRGFFARPNDVVMGRESADHALHRFSAGVDAAIAACSEGSVAVVSHGTVISLFAAAHNDLDALAFWRHLGMPGIVVLSIPEFRLIGVP